MKLKESFSSKNAIENAVLRDLHCGRPDIRKCDISYQLKEGDFLINTFFFLVDRCKSCNRYWAKDK